jgi:hypothetical protein
MYLNAAGNTLRVDEISVPILPPVVQQPNVTILNDPGLQMRVGPQTINTKLMAQTSGSRVVHSIEIYGDFTDYEASSGSFAWVSKTLGNGQIILCDMSNLPATSDSV